jgi:hypothetical protein
MADETTGGTDWGSLITLLAGVIGGLSSGQTLTGKPARMESTTAPLTPEGQRIMDEYQRTLDATPMMGSTSMGNVSATFPNKSRVGILKNMVALELLRKGGLTNLPAETGILGNLAPILASLKKKQDPYQMGLDKTGANSPYGPYESGYQFPETNSPVGPYASGYQFPEDNNNTDLFTKWMNSGE